MEMSFPGRFPRGSRPGRWLKGVLALYVLAAALMPLGHHDIVCHLKSSTHCTTCVVGSSAEAAADPAVLARWWLLDAGIALADADTLLATPVFGPFSGRAPPALG